MCVCGWVGADRHMDRVEAVGPRSSYDHRVGRGRWQGGRTVLILRFQDRVEKHRRAFLGVVLLPQGKGRSSGEHAEQHVETGHGGGCGRRALVWGTWTAACLRRLKDPIHEELRDGLQITAREKSIQHQ